MSLFNHTHTRTRTQTPRTLQHLFALVAEGQRRGNRFDDVAALTSAVAAETKQRAASHQVSQCMTVMHAYLCTQANLLYSCPGLDMIGLLVAAHPNSAPPFPS